MQTNLTIKNCSRILAYFGTFSVLVGCGSVPDPIDMPNGDYRNSVRHIPYAASEPIRDLNIGVAPIPRQLAVLQNPYGTDTHKSCAAILKETKDLEAAIEKNYRLLYGPDYNRNTRAGNIGEASHEIVRSTAASLIPYRGIVRYASGAYHRDKAGLEADRRGRERLGFLIASGQARRCPGFKPAS